MKAVWLINSVIASLIRQISNIIGKKLHMRHVDQIKELNVEYK